MITFSPLLAWKNLFKIIFLADVDDLVLAKPWCKEGDTPVWFSKTAWSLVAICIWWEKTFLKKRPTIFVPGYFCNQSLWPLRQCQVNLIFYPVNDKLEPDWDVCYRLAKESNPDIFILTHFYGLISDTIETKKFCELHGALFVEDAAHEMIPIGQVGKQSHFVLYSPHKFFPISQGALCIIRPSVKKYVNTLHGSNVDFFTVRNSLGKERNSFAKWVARQLAKSIIRDYSLRFKTPTDYEHDCAAQPMPTKPFMSSSAKKLLLLEQKKIQSTIKHRKECAEIWEYLLSKENIKMQRVSSGNANEIPYVAVFNSTHNEAPSIYKRLTKKKWPASSWPDLPPEVRENSELHAAAIHFRNNMIIFPVNQSLKIAELLKNYSADQKCKSSDLI